MPRSLPRGQAYEIFRFLSENGLFFEQDFIVIGYVGYRTVVGGGALAGVIRSVLLSRTYGPRPHTILRYGPQASLLHYAESPG